MRLSHIARATLGALALLSSFAAARADFNVNPATSQSPAVWCGFSVSTVVLPCDVMVNSAKQEIFTAASPGFVGLSFGGAALTLGPKAKAGSIPVAPPTDPDIFTTAVSLTAADAASVTATGQNGVSVISGTPTAGSFMTVAVNGQAEADFTIAGTFVGTIEFEGSSNNGASYTPRAAHVIGTKYRQSQLTGPGIFHVNAAGLTNVRARMIAFTSGSASVALNTTATFGSAYVMNDLELVDNATGLSPTVKQAGTAALTDNAFTVFDPQLDYDIKQTAAPADVPGNAPASGAKVPWVQPVPGLNQTKNSCRLPVSAASTNLAQCGTGAKTVTHIRFCNLSTTVQAVLRLYNAASATVGTTAVAASIWAAPNQCAFGDWPEGYVFGTALSYSLTAGDGDSDTTALGAGQVKGLNIDTIN